MDAIGAAAGMVCAARVKNKPVHIVVDREHTMASDLIERLRRRASTRALFVSAEDAMIMCDFNTLSSSWTSTVRAMSRARHCSSPSTKSRSSTTTAVRRTISKTLSSACTEPYASSASGACQRAASVPQFRRAAS
ncbi:MAG: hypothetical protein ACLR4Z_03025 [Butyricicoccaceae bacterium]